MNKIIFLTSGLVLCLLLSACGSSVTLPSSSEAPSGSEKSSDTVSVTVKDKTGSSPTVLTVEKQSETTPTPVEDTPLVNVTVSQSGFFPAQLETKAGVITKLHFTSADVRHSFVIPVLGYRVEIPARGEATLDILVREPGSYEFLSDIYSGANTENLGGVLTVK